MSPQDNLDLPSHPANSETQSLFAVLRQSADADAVAALERLVQNGADRELCRINVPAFAAERGLDPEPVIGAFLHAARIGVFDMSWNVLCPGCGGVLNASATLKSMTRNQYDCALCAAGYAPTLDDLVGVSIQPSHPRGSLIDMTRTGSSSPNTCARSSGVRASMCPMVSSR